MALHSSMASSSKQRRIFLFVVILFSFAASTAWAEFNFQNYRNRNSPHYTLLDSPSEGRTPEKSPIFESFVYHYFHNPIGYDQADEGSGTLVPSLHSINYAGEYSWNIFAVGLDIPIHQLEFYQKGSNFALGDLRLFIRSNLYRGQSTATSIVTSIYMPTGNEDLFLSNPNGGAGVNLASEKKWGKTRGAINLGGDYFPNAFYKTVSYEWQYYLGVGFNHQLSEKWRAQAEWMGRQIDSYLRGDLYLGGEYELSQKRTVFFGTSLASSKFDEENLEYKIFAGMKFSPADKIIITHQKKIETIQSNKTLQECSPKPYKRIFYGRALKKSEIENLITLKKLPYLSTKKHAIGIFKPGESSGFGEKNLSFVRDGQVLFAIDIDKLPARENLISIDTLELELIVNRMDSEEKTDMICLINQKICSGDLYSDRARQENINFKFFSGKEPPNDYFLRQFSNPPIMSGVNIKKIRIQLPLQKLIENSTFPDVSNLVYLDSSVSPTGTLYFAVAHDVFVSSKIRLNLEMSVQTCSETDLEPSIETKEENTYTEEPGNE